MLGRGFQIPEAADDLSLAEFVHDSKGVDDSVEVMRERVDDGHTGEVIIKAVQSEFVRSEGLDNPDLLINPINDSIQGLRGFLFDGEEVLVGLEPGSRGGLDEGALESGPDLGRVLLMVSDIGLGLRRHTGDKDASSLERLVHPFHILPPVSLLLLKLLGINSRLSPMLGRTGLCARDNHPKLGHHEEVLHLVNPESVVGAIQLGNLVQTRV